MSLYLDSNNGSGYQLQSSAFVSGAMYMGDPNNPDPDYEWPDWSGTWSVGRGYFAGASDWFDGIIDEVRISNSALVPADFLFAPGATGDFNVDGVVDAADYVVWRKGPSTTYTPSQYDTWRSHFGYPQGSGSSAIVNSAVPEPATLVLLMVSAFGACFRRRRATT